MLSSLLLADGEALTVYELMGLRLDADLVVLSACETGRGKVTGGDEVLGLTRGLLASGARAAVVSLWPVSDASTTLLMGAFYRRLRAGDSPAQALRSAQNYLRRLRGDAIDQELERLQEAVETSIARRGNGRRNREFDAGIRNNGSHRRRQTESRDYSHPFYWAPFVLVG